MIERVYTAGLAQVAYLVADEEAALAVVIDPRRDVDAYLRWSEQTGNRIVAILETHVHADFVSGARELAAATGATVYLSRAGGSELPHDPLDDGATVAVGALRLTALATPGHTPEHLAFLLVEPGQDAPSALFSGDALFVGEVGRPDLLGEEHTNALVDRLYDTVFVRFSALPDDLIVYPGHTAGSACGRSIGDGPSTTIGQEKRFNYAFRPGSREEFAAAILAGMPKPPSYYPTLKRINKRGPALLADLPPGEPLAVDAVADLQRDKALILDTRSLEAFNGGHIPGSLFAGLGTNFTAWMGWIAPYDRPLVLVLDGPEWYADARTELRRIGLDCLAGYLDGGIAAWQAAGRPTEMIPTITIPDLALRLARRTELSLLDVRGPDEWRSGHARGALHRFAGDIAQGAPLPEGTGGQVAVICASGYRSTVAASLLQARGVEGLFNVEGGMDAWQKAGLPVVTE